ncbi:hypothetical protein SEVIR_8G152500v4 [Setaria viridis]|uniref:Uncharacterized protein n=1 Tax=Setaria viridis TaxID=4556 RepID=A0A4U6THE9_SETVI|nr:UPF0481 protein At3g47200-like [Setaria viridis]TKW01062.1 hypothetical protein SEVIR_8G152500v2 [Setaria viridis]
MRAKGKAISSCSAMEIGKKKFLEHSGQANHKLVDESETLRAEENGSCNSWVVDMPKMLEQADPSVEMARWKQRSIYRVPEFIKKTTNSDAYRPQFVSLGPYHHREPHLLAMEEHKRRALVHLVKRAGKPHTYVQFVEAIEEVVDELQAAYDDLDDKWRGANIGSFVEMMVTDGCFLLELIMMVDSILRNDEIVDDYAADDPIFSKRSFLVLWPVMRKDMIAMENQLPLVVLQRLLAVQRGTPPKAREINYMVGNLLDVECFEEHMDKLGLHFLDIYYKSYCGVSPCWEGSDYDELRAPCAVEMSEAGIQFKKSNTNSIHDVDFEDAVLSMPLFDFNDSTETILLNLMAFEWLHPYAKDDVVAYVSFMDDIIQSERDVALLESEGIVLDITGSKQMVEMFNYSLTRLGRVNVGNRLGHVQWKIKTYCRKRRNRWQASFVNTYLSNPWVFISLVAAVILLVATLLQTVYTIVPFYTKG